MRQTPRSKRPRPPSPDSCVPETLRVVGGPPHRLLQLAAHLDRFACSARTLELPEPDRAAWTALARAVSDEVPAGAEAIVPKARARPASVTAITGAPQPSTAVEVISSPVSSASVCAMACCSGCEGSRYVAVSQPLTTQVASIAACLPEQFWVMGSLLPPLRRTASRASSFTG